MTLSTAQNLTNKPYSKILSNWTANEHDKNKSKEIEVPVKVLYPRPPVFPKASKEFRDSNALFPPLAGCSNLHASGIRIGVN